MKKRQVQAYVKDEQLIEKRRDQMIKGAVSLFKEKGFHRTTTREIAREAGFSIGTLYEYIRQKEDVLYLVCDTIYDQVYSRLKEDIDTKEGTVESLIKAIKTYFYVVHDMQDEVLVMYQEAKSLSKDALPYVLKKELEMTNLFKQMIKTCVNTGELKLTEQQCELLANNIVVQGEMWAFRRWTLQKHYTLEQYIEFQTDFITHGMVKLN